MQQEASGASQARALPTEPAFAVAHELLNRFRRRAAHGEVGTKGVPEYSTLSMTLRYMHLAPSALCEAIDLLNFGQPVGSAEAAAV